VLVAGWRQLHGDLGAVDLAVAQFAYPWHDGGSSAN
jgi:hypothetical protein